MLTSSSSTTIHLISTDSNVFLPCQYQAVLPALKGKEASAWAEIDLLGGLDHPNIVCLSLSCPLLAKGKFNDHDTVIAIRSVLDPIDHYYHDIIHQDLGYICFPLSSPLPSHT